VFKTLNSLLTYKTPSKEEIEKINSFVMIRWLSNNQLTVVPSNFVNFDIPVYNQYLFLDTYFKLSGIKNKVKFIPYNKSKKEEIVENIARWYNVNYNTAQQYYDLMDTNQRKKFKNIFKEGQ
jgi:hypothetical protein